MESDTREYFKLRRGMCYVCKAEWVTSFDKPGQKCGLCGSQDILIGAQQWPQCSDHDHEGAVSRYRQSSVNG